MVLLISRTILEDIWQATGPWKEPLGPGRSLWAPEGAPEPRKEPLGPGRSPLALIGAPGAHHCFPILFGEERAFKLPMKP